MASLRKYFKLMKDHPELFSNPDEPGVIKIITDPQELRLLQAELKKEFKGSGKKSEWVDIGVLGEDQWEYIVRDLVRHPDGRIGGYNRSISRVALQGAMGVVVMPVLSEEVLLLKHFRHESRSWLWEFPRGYGELGLSGEENAKKELMEEVGLPPIKLFEIGRDTGTAFYYAELKKGMPRKPTDEAIQKIELVSLEELGNWIISGKITDWYTIMAYLMCKNKNLL
ncbi:MAG: NUDIX hydrolase [Chloroflexota bacterium]